MADLLPSVEKGCQDGPLIVFMAGFPDNATSGWGDVIPSELGKNNRLLFMCLPDFQKGNTVYKPWGYSFKEIVERMHNTIQSVNKSKEKIVLIGHDWGAHLALLYENRYPQFVGKVILLDVGLLKPPEVPIVELLLILLYQFWFAIAFIIASTVNFSLGDMYFKAYYAPFLKFLSPCPKDTLTIPENEFSVNRCYPYYHYWKGKFTGTGVEPRFPSCPLLYLYGTDKRCSFHGKSFINRIERNKVQGHKCVEIVGGDIVGMASLLPFVEAGRKDGPLMVFMAGFPDNETSGWGDVVPAELGKEYRLLFLCMPDYQKGNKVYKPWGYSFTDILDRMNNTIASVNKNNEKVILVSHDWGAFMGLVFENKYPQLVKKLILLDVGLLKPQDAPVKDLLIILCYQWWFAIAYIIARVVSVSIADIIFKLFFSPVIRSVVSPCPHDTLTIPEEDMTVLQCYPYYQFWKGQFSGTMFNPRFPSCPLLFMYGTKKNCMFHGKSFIAKIDKTPHCKQVPFEAGHWFVKTHGREVVKTIYDFLK